MCRLRCSAAAAFEIRGNASIFVLEASHPYTTILCMFHHNSQGASPKLVAGLMV